MSTTNPALEAAKAVVKIQVRSWGKRDIYPIELGEAQILVNGGATFNVRNADNRDGTFHSTLVFDGLTFELSSTELL